MHLQINYQTARKGTRSVDTAVSRYWRNKTTITITNKIVDTTLITFILSAFTLYWCSFNALVYYHPTEWWKYRANILGVSTTDLKVMVESLGKKYESQRQALMHIDKYELVKICVIDLLMSLGRTEEYAQNVGKFAKEIAKQIKIPLYDDLNLSIDFKSSEDHELIDKITNDSSPMLLGKF